MIEKSMFCHPWGIMAGDKRSLPDLSYEATDFLTKRLYRKKAGP
jgi:hypothetical protein